MNLELGQKVKVVFKDGKAGYKRVGFISLIKPYYVQVQFKNYKECYHISFLDPESDVDIFIKVNGVWEKVTRRENTNLDCLNDVEILNNE